MERQTSQVSEESLGKSLTFFRGAKKRGRKPKERPLTSSVPSYFGMLEIDLNSKLKNDEVAVRKQLFPCVLVLASNSMAFTSLVDSTGLHLTTPPKFWDERAAIFEDGAMD